MPTALYYLHNPFAPVPNRPTRFGSAVVIMAENKVLLEHRRDNFRWGIVSGDMKNTETFRDCAIRKTIQETGIHLSHDELHDIKVFDDPSRIVSFLEGNIYRIVHYGFYAELEKIPATQFGKESIELSWVDPMELDQFELSVTHQDVLEEFFRLKDIKHTMKTPLFPNPHN